MIRTGYLRWEIEVTDARAAGDAQAREVHFLARPSYRTVRVKRSAASERAAEKFAVGAAAYEEVIRARQRPTEEHDVTVPNVGPHVFRYSEADRTRLPRFWMEKLQREAAAFAHEVIRAASKFPRFVVSSPVLRAGYAKLVEHEVMRVIEGKSLPAPTCEEGPMRLDIGATDAGVPELVAAELVRDVVEPGEFSEFCTYDRITIRNGEYYYRIMRRSHAHIEVWNATTLKGETRLCVVFQDPGMPPSDEVVMKYLLAKHQPKMLWDIGIKFEAPRGRFAGAPSPRRRYS